MKRNSSGNTGGHVIFFSEFTPFRELLGFARLSDEIAWTPDNTDHNITSLNGQAIRTNFNFLIGFWKEYTSKQMTDFDAAAAQLQQ